MNTSIEPRKTVPSRMEGQLDFILLDGSGSMKEKWWDMLAALDAYVSGLKAANVRSRMLLTVFDSNDLELVQRDTPPENWRPFYEEPIGSHWGMTPLYDAIQLMGRKLRDLDPVRCAITIVTDGMEEGSTFTSLPQARSILDWCRAKGWSVTFIGCDFNNSHQAAALGVSEANALGVDKRLLSDAAATLARKRANYGLYGTPVSFTEDERQQFGGFLPAPEGK